MKCRIFRRARHARQETDAPAAVAAAVGEIEALCRTIRDALPAMAAGRRETPVPSPSLSDGEARDIRHLIDEWLNGEEGAHERSAS